MADFGLGLVGSGFMGKAHALAFRNARAVMGGLPEIALSILCDTPRERAEFMAGQLGFARAADDWRAVVADPAIDIVAIATPTRLHHEIALAALAAGKHVYCEKPMAQALPAAREMAAAAAAAESCTLVGYNYLKNPAIAHAARLIGDGAIGRVVDFRGVVDEDYLADPQAPWSWRVRADEGGLGTLGDLGCHLVAFAHALVGPVESLVAQTTTVHAARPVPGGDHVPVENEDTASALLRFAGGLQGSIASSRVAWGRKNRLAVEVHGAGGLIAFDQERMNELTLFTAEGPSAVRGSRTILTGPDHPPYGAFSPAAGHQLGFNDLKTIEVAELLSAIAAGRRASPDFAEALAVEEVIHAADRSARSGLREAIPAPTG